MTATGPNRSRKRPWATEQTPDGYADGQDAPDAAETHTRAALDAIAYAILARTENP